MVGIPSPEARMEEYTFQFSGGMRQRAMIAMALGAKPGPGLRGQLEALLEAVITGQLPNERKALLAAVKIELDP